MAACLHGYLIMGCIDCINEEQLGQKVCVTIVTSITY